MIADMSETTEDIARRAAAAFNAGRAAEARRLCETGLRQSPDDAILSHLLAAVLFAVEDTAAARLHIETSVSRRPDHAAARLLAARIARVAKDFEPALAHVDRAIALSPHREAFIEKARILDQAGMAPQALAAWQAILKVMPAHEEALARLGRLSWETGDLDAARDVLERAAGPAAPASVWFDLGLVRQDASDLAGAAAAYRRALAVKPDHAEAALNLGTVLQESGEPDAAMQAYANAYRLRPQMFGAIAMALTSAPHGRLWIDPAALKRALGSAL
ncbi:conserved hypothetical protein [Bradyrhizobium sp. STM 3809]|nr:conserved hypothetical protein [Bradyrhizobium sp. STM 3809]